MDKNLEMNLKTHNNNDLVMAKAIDRLEIDSYHKVAFFNLMIHRGIVKYEDFLEAMKFIYDNNKDCYVLKKLLDGKECGLATIELFARAKPKKRAEVYEQINIKGVKRADIEKLFMLPYNPTLFDGIDDEA